MSVSFKRGRRMPYHCAQSAQRGFTLIELIIVMVLMGIIGAMVAVFMKAPIDAYLTSSRRADLTDAADTTVRRMARDIRKALPNSIRSAGSECVEFIPSKTGGRYRSEVDSTVTGGTPADSVLTFTALDTRFNKLGDNPATPADQQIREGDLIAIYNLGIAGADAYNLDNLSRVRAEPTDIPARVLGIGVTAITYGAETQMTTSGRATAYPLESGSKRFQVIPAQEQVVSYVCTGAGLTAAGEGTGTLRRYARADLLTATGGTVYAAPATCVALESGMKLHLASAAVLAQNVSACSFSYDPLNQTNATVQMSLSLTRSSETVNLYHEVHVNNTP